MVCGATVCWNITRPMVCCRRKVGNACLRRPSIRHYAELAASFHEAEELNAAIDLADLKRLALP